ncbi:unnamed protein product [Amoebophrya sp. A25]|nr:unnamed protein product [Amoebophrya sp. A25]|eukprot:GSA25T00010010001.1
MMRLSFWICAAGKQLGVVNGDANKRRHATGSTSASTTSTEPSAAGGWTGGTAARLPFYYWSLDSIVKEAFTALREGVSSTSTADNSFDIEAAATDFSALDLAFHNRPANQFGPCSFQNTTFDTCVSSEVLRLCRGGKTGRDAEAGVGNHQATGGSGSSATTGVVSPASNTPRDSEQHAHCGPKDKEIKLVCSAAESALAQREKERVHQEGSIMFRNAKCEKKWVQDEQGLPTVQTQCMYEVYEEIDSWMAKQTTNKSEGGPDASISAPKPKDETTSKNGRPHRARSFASPEIEERRRLAREKEAAKKEQKHTCSAVPVEFFKHVPKCFDWSISGSAWEEFGERDLAYLYARSGRARSVLEFGGGSGSVSVVIQEGMKQWNQDLVDGKMKDFSSTSSSSTGGTSKTRKNNDHLDQSTWEDGIGILRKEFGVLPRGSTNEYRYSSEFSAPPNWYLPPSHRSIDIRNHVVIQPNAATFGVEDVYEGLEGLMENVEYGALAENRRLCKNHYQIVDHSLNPNESEVWLLRGMLTEPFDFVMADCEGCLVDEFRKNPKLFDYVKTIVVERDDTLEGAYSATGVAVAHNRTGPYNLLFSHLNMRRKHVRLGCGGTCDVEAWERELPA